uniref:Uncharacterized protein n=1 Tax=Rhizophora mucronata TaxID=61149 RepID=A0A2P2NM28_RHIMU
MLTVTFNYLSYFLLNADNLLICLQYLADILVRWALQ